jgi:hypothetical protein
MGGASSSIRVVRLVLAAAGAVAVAIVVVTLSSAPASAQAACEHLMDVPPDPMPAPAEAGIYPAIFPVVGDHYYSDTWGACRSGGTRGHKGVDIMTYGVKGVPVVAAASGTVGWISSSCCALALNHDDGWTSWYIHLNNDTPGTDDGLGWGYADGIASGVHVEAGQLIGWVGDSGNAESAGAHLHWELQAPGGAWVNPTPQADAALHITEPGILSVEPLCPEDGVCDAVAFVDGTGQWHLRDSLDPRAEVDSFFFGNPGDVPFMGDWDGDGVATPGLYRRSDGFVYLRNSNTQGVADYEFFFGDPGDFPVVGDFDGDGLDTVSIYRQSEGRVYVMNRLGADGGGLGAADFDFLFGNPGDAPFVGDFDGDGIDSVGLYRRATGFVYFRDGLSSGVADFEFFYGDPGDVIVAGDWDGDGDDTVAVYRPGDGRFYVNLENAPGAADHTIFVGTYPFAATAEMD